MAFTFNESLHAMEDKEFCSSWALYAFGFVRPMGQERGDGSSPTNRALLTCSKKWTSIGPSHLECVLVHIVKFN